jgi:hypothetical protein
MDVNQSDLGLPKLSSLKGNNEGVDSIDSSFLL